MKKNPKHKKFKAPKGVNAVSLNLKSGELVKMMPAKIAEAVERYQQCIKDTETARLHVLDCEEKARAAGNSFKDLYEQKDTLQKEVLELLQKVD